MNIDAQVSIPVSTALTDLLGHESTSFCLVQSYKTLAAPMLISSRGRDGSDASIRPRYTAHVGDLFSVLRMKMKKRERRLSLYMFELT